MARLSCPTCGANVNLRPFFALHRWPSAYPQDAAEAVVPCDAGDPLTVRVIVLDDDPVEAGGGARRP